MQPTPEPEGATSWCGGPNSSVEGRVQKNVHQIMLRVEALTNFTPQSLNDTAEAIPTLNMEQKQKKKKKKKDVDSIPGLLARWVTALPKVVA